MVDVTQYRFRVDELSDDAKQALRESDVPLTDTLCLLVERCAQANRAQTRITNACLLLTRLLKEHQTDINMPLAGGLLSDSMQRFDHAESEVKYYDGQLFEHLERLAEESRQ